MRHHDRRSMRSTLLWLSRQLLGADGDPHVGMLRVAIRGGHGEELILRDGPKSGREELTRRLGEALLSDQERSIVAELTAGPSKGEALIGRCRIERSRLYTIAAHLQDRQVIVKDDLGYSLAPWLSDALKDSDFLAILGLPAPPTPAEDG